MHDARSLIAATACLLAAATAAAGQPTDAEIAALAQKHAGASIAQRRDSTRTRSSATASSHRELVAEHLRGLGFERADRRRHTGVVGVLKGGSPGRSWPARRHGRAAGDEETDLPFTSKVRSRRTTASRSA